MKKQRINHTVTKPKSPNQSLVKKLSQQKRYLNQSPIVKKKAIKLDLKLQYLNNEIYEKNKFRQFLQEINLQTKQLIKNQDMLNDTKADNERLNRRRNSFNLNVETFKNNLVMKDNKETDQTIKQEDTKNYLDFKPSKIDVTRLSLIKQKIGSKVVSVNNQIQQIKKKLRSSSIWQDKQFYDFTQLNYEIKTQDIEERLEKSEKNLQQKQRIKKQIVSTGLVNKGQNVKVIKFGQYQFGSEQGIIVSNYVGIKRRLMNEFSKINRVYKRMRDIRQNGQFAGYMRQQSRQQNSQVEGIVFQLQNSNPCIKAAVQVRQQMSNIIKGIQQKNRKKVELQIKNNKLNKGVNRQIIKRRKQYKGQDNKQYRQSKQLSREQNVRQQNVRQQILDRMRGINGDILNRQLNKTKNRINELKQSTQCIQKSIKQLQGYKALIILRNNHIQNLNQFNNNNNNNHNNNKNNKNNYNNNKNNNKHSNKHNKSIRQSQKNKFDNQILRLILEHQLLNQTLSLHIQTKFSTLLYKNNIHSHSYHNLSSNHYPNINTINKYHSLTNIQSFNHSLSPSSTKSNIKIQPLNPQSIIKKTGIQIITPKIKIKQIGSSAQTNP